MLNISGLSSSSILSSSYLEALVAQAMTYQRRGYDLVLAQRDQLDTTRSLLTDLQDLFDDLDDRIKGLAAGTTSIFGSKSVTSSDTDVATATATSSANLGTYELSITTLAKAHRVRSDAQTYSDQALGLSGTFYIGGLASRAVSSESYLTNTVTDFNVGSVTSGQQELGSGTYYVEVRNNAGTWEFRLVNADGTAISIADVDDADSFTSSWQSLATVAGQTYNTGRGLTITFGSGSFTQGSASVRYDAQGVAVNVATTDSLTSIANAINNGTYAEGNQVVASVVQAARGENYLILEAANTGTTHQIIASDSSGTVLQSLGILTAPNTFKNTLQSATDASFSVNGLSVTRSRNAGLTDVISGVTLNLLMEGTSATADLTVVADTATVTTKINEFLTAFNTLVNYLQANSNTTQNADGTTYTRGGLSNEPILYRLRFSLLSDLNRSVPQAGESALPTGDPTSLSEIGITMDDNLNLTVSDSGKLSAALTSNFQGVARLFDVLMDRLTARLDPYTRTVDSLMDQLIESVDDQIEDANDTLKDMRERMQWREASLRRQYAALFNQIYAASGDQSLVSVLFSNIA